jgi:hypothetical protein
MLPSLLSIAAFHSLFGKDGPMNIAIFGATGMVGKGVLLECLDDPRVERVLVVSRRPVALRNPKLREVVHQDFPGIEQLPRSNPPLRYTPTASATRIPSRAANG